MKQKVGTQPNCMHEYNTNTMCTFDRPQMKMNNTTRFWQAFLGEDADRQSPAIPSSEDRHMQGVKAEVAGALQRIAAQERENMSAMRAAVSKAKTKKTAALW